MDSLRSLAIAINIMEEEVRSIGREMEGIKNEIKRIKKEAAAGETSEASVRFDGSDILGNMSSNLEAFISAAKKATEENKHHCAHAGQQKGSNT